MAITVEVGLLSGKGVTIKAGLDEEVAMLKDRAQLALQVGNGQLVDSFGSILDAHVLIRDAGLQNGDALTLHVKQLHVRSSLGAFFAILGDGSVVSWGHSGLGNDSSDVRDQLKNVHQIQTNATSFAAILGDGSVVTWGNIYFGGDSSYVQDQLKKVQHIQASVHAFAAILRDGTVVTWGTAACGGDSSAVQDQLRTVQQIQATHSAFAAHSWRWISGDLG